MNRYLEEYLEWVKMDNTLEKLKLDIGSNIGQLLSPSIGIIKYMNKLVPKDEHHDFFMELMPSLKKDYCY